MALIVPQDCWCMPCESDCCCVEVGFEFCVTLMGCGSGTILDCNEAKVTVGWNEVPDCVLELAGGDPISYRIFDGTGTADDIDDASEPWLRVDSPGPEDCDSGSAPVVPRDKWTANPGNCPECAPLRLLLCIFAGSTLILTCYACHEEEVCDVECGDCFGAVAATNGRYVEDWKCGFPNLSSPDWHIPMPDDDRRWRKLTMRWKNTQTYTITGPPTGNCGTATGSVFYSAHLDVGAVWNTTDPPYSGDAGCKTDLALDGAEVCTDTAGSSVVSIDDPGAEPTYRAGPGPAGPPFIYGGPAEEQFGNCCFTGCSTLTGGGSATHQTYTRTDSDAFGPPEPDGCHIGFENCNCTCVSTDDIEMTLEDEFPFAEVVANVEAAMASDFPSYQGAIAKGWVFRGKDRDHATGGELFLAANWRDYVVFGTHPPGYNVIVFWDVNTYVCTDSGGSPGAHISTAHMTLTNPVGDVLFQLQPPINGPNVVMIVENEGYYCVPA